MKLRCVVLEDQAPARRLLESHIGQRDELELIGSTAFPSMAAAMLAQEEIDLMFLDLHLPQADGFEFLGSLVSPPAIIVTTAFPDRALEGFERGVIDYLVKPFSPDRFSQSVDRALLLKGRSSSNTRLEVQLGRGRFLYLELDNIIRLSADGDYVQIITEERTHHVAGPLSRLAEKLPARQFVQIHRSHIVNLERIEERNARDVLVDGMRIRIGGNYASSLAGLMSD